MPPRRCWASAKGHSEPVVTLQGLEWEKNGEGMKVVHAARGRDTGLGSTGGGGGWRVQPRVGQSAGEEESSRVTQVWWQRWWQLVA